MWMEPVPKGWSPIDGYTLEFQDGTRVTGEMFPSETLAVSETKLRGYTPWLPKVRITDKADNAHWQLAEAA